MAVRFGWTSGESLKISGIGYEPKGELSDPISPFLIQAGLLCNNGGLKMKNDGWHHYGDPTEVALLVSAAKAGGGPGGNRRIESCLYRSASDDRPASGRCD